MENDVPKVNFFIDYVETMNGRKSNDPYLKSHLRTRRFYGSFEDNDYVKYVNNGSNEVLDYVEYSGNNEKSHGVFNENGLMDKEARKELRNQLRETQSPIWFGLISFTEEFGNRYCNNSEKAIALMKYEFPKFFKNAGLNPDNIVWYAGLHENTDNKHIHFSFFEKAPERYKQNCKSKVFSNGFLPLKAINKLKVSVELKLLNSQTDIYTSRNTLTKKMRKNIELGAYMKHINSLVYVIPQEKRISYDSENIKPYRSQIDMIINSIIRADKDLQKEFIEFDKYLIKRDEEIKNAYSKLNIDYSDKLLRDKCIQDIYKRLGNIVLYTVKDIRYSQKKVEYETKNRLALKRIEKNKRKILINKCMYLNDLVNAEIINAFQEYRAKLANARYKRLKQEGYLD